jgi:hypothetical protein
MEEQARNIGEPSSEQGRRSYEEKREIEYIRTDMVVANARIEEQKKVIGRILTRLNKLDKKEEGMHYRFL